jgi:chaperonin cofactor prefoldin
MASEQSIEDVMKLNTELIQRVSELSTRVNELIVRIQTATPEERELSQRVDKLEKRLNAFIITMLSRRRAQAPMPGPMM